MYHGLVCLSFYTNIGMAYASRYVILLHIRFTDLKKSFLQLSQTVFVSDRVRLSRDICFIFNYKLVFTNSCVTKAVSGLAYFIFLFIFLSQMHLLGCFQIRYFAVLFLL